VPNEFVDLNLRNIRIWFLLAFQAGAVNAGGFLACNRFVTHTTGFATHFAVELATHHEGAALGMLSVPFFFLLGSMTTAYFVELRLLHGRSANYTAPTFLVFLCLALALFLGRLGLFGLFKQEMTLRDDYFLLVLLSLASGLQNALITNSQGVVVRTTHLTGMTTDLAVGLVRTLFGEKEVNPTRLERDRRATLARAGIIGSFIFGSTVSAYLYLRTQYLGFAVPVFTSLVLLRYFVARTRAKELPRSGGVVARESPH
jgi:uncharacterized membrane protein YoaK (UPF0700 family)